MLDRLLGRARLRERIEELEDEVERLEDRLEAENERRAEAVTEKQEAERRVNRLESKIDELQDRVERAESDDETRRFTRVRQMGLGGTRSLLDLLESVEGDDEALTTAYVAPTGDVPDEFDDSGLLRRIDSSTGLVALSDDVGVVRACLVPPLAVSDPRTEHSSRFELDRSLFEPRSTYVVAAVRSDSYAAGVYDTEGRVSYSSIDSNVKSKHSKGGFSQGRFERIRDEQVGRHVSSAVEDLGELVGDNRPDTVAVTGESMLIDEVAAEIDVDADVVTRAVDATGEGEGLLAEAHGKFWTSRLYVF